jgi:hypothetical protein
VLRLEQLSVMLAIPAGDAVAAGTDAACTSPAPSAVVQSTTMRLTQQRKIIRHLGTQDNNLPPMTSA